MKNVSFNVGGPASFSDVDLPATGDDALIRVKTDKSVAAYLFATLDRLEQKALALLPRRAQKGRYRSFEVGSKSAANRNERVLFGERQKFFVAGLNKTR